MPSIMINCTRTGRPISTGIDTDPVSFRLMPNVVATAHCPLCHVEHTWTTAHAWICERVPTPCPKRAS
jgi:hypothetical protein